MRVSFDRFSTTMDAEHFAKRMSGGPGDMFAWIDQEHDPCVVITEESMDGIDDDEVIEAFDYRAMLDGDDEGNYWVITHKESDEVIMRVKADPEDNTNVIRLIRGLETF